MIDAHSHVLPGIDDGSKNVTESVAMLQKMAAQGVTAAAATPHYYASAQEPARFFEKRQMAWEKLMQSENIPQIDLRPGAEVLYYEGLQSQKLLLDFRISGTELFLLEMPFSKWSERMIRGIIDLNTERQMTVVLAHVDRYLPWQSVELFEKLAAEGILMQVNADSLLHWRTRRKTLQLFRMGIVQFVGSDCHNLTDRAPNVSSAMEVLQKKLGAESVQYLQEAEEDMFRCGSVRV